jgi:hypothetical protein
VGGEHFVEASAASVALLDEAVARGGAELRRHLQQPVELLDLEFEVFFDEVDQLFPCAGFHRSGLAGEAGNEDAFIRLGGLQGVDG